MLKSGIKRFYKAVDVRAEPSSFAVRLDNRPVKTPAGHALLAPTRGLAEAIADEWRAQGETIVPDTMPLTKLLNTALDRIPLHRGAVVDDLANYAGADLLCYRAESPAELARRQAAAWDPWLDWAAERFGARLTVTTGVAHVAQPDQALARLRQAITAIDSHRLVALHAAVTITGSAVLGLAFAARVLEAEAAFAAAHIDHAYQADLWGRDAEAESIRARRLDDLRAAQRYLVLLPHADAT
jgi:chaperone required for assembly of F1-ATPase